MRKLEPGVYLNGTELHLSSTELCAAAGVPLTPENAVRLERAVIARLGKPIPEPHVFDEQPSGTVKP
jgi:hypothetical protein